MKEKKKGWVKSFFFICFWKTKVLWGNMLVEEFFLVRIVLGKLFFKKKDFGKTKFG